MKKLALIAALVSCSPAALAATNYLGPILKVGSRGNGTVFIEISQAVGLPQCSQNQIEILGSLRISGSTPFRIDRRSGRHPPRKRKWAPPLARPRPF